ncbi:MAG: hypothetical protein K2Q22_09670, partial [Cytophagales bacterium]|nr:hypothetical protein [Cytophagales bacterium]
MEYFPNAIIYTGFPPLTPDNTSVIDPATAEILFERVSKQGIEFNYMQGNCHNRAHVLCMLLASYGVTPAKIWAFAPGIFSVDDPILISIPDKNGISAQGNIQWGYHVVPFLLVYEGDRIETWVFDPALFPDGPVVYSVWLEQLHIPNLLCLRMDWEWYLYNSLPWNLSQLYQDFLQPSAWNRGEEAELLLDMPLHDFFLYEMDSKSNFWLEKGLAIDETAFAFYKNEIQPLMGISKRKDLFDDYRLLVGDV